MLVAIELGLGKKIKQWYMYCNKANMPALDLGPSVIDQDVVNEAMRVEKSLDH